MGTPRDRIFRHPDSREKAPRDEIGVVVLFSGSRRHDHAASVYGGDRVHVGRALQHAPSVSNVDQYVPVALSDEDGISHGKSIHQACGRLDRPGWIGREIQRDGAARRTRCRQGTACRLEREFYRTAVAASGCMALFSRQNVSGGERCMPAQIDLVRRGKPP